MKRILLILASVLLFSLPVLAQELPVIVDFTLDFRTMTPVSNGVFLCEDDDGSIIYDAKAGKTVSSYYDYLVVMDGVDDEGYFMAMKDGKWGIVSMNGVEIVPVAYEAMLPSSEMGLVPVMLDRAWGYIDLADRVVIDFQYDTALAFREDGVAIIAQEGKYGLIDSDGETLVACIYDNLASNPYMMEKDTFRAKLDGKTGCIDSQGNVLVPFEYDGLYSYSEDLAWAQKGDSFGAIDITGNVVIPFDYASSDMGLHFLQGIVVLRDKEGRWGALNREGEELIPFEYENMKRSNKYEEPIMTFKNGLWGYCDIGGNVLFDNQFEDGWRFSEGMARAKKEDQWYLIDSIGNIICELPYDHEGESSEANEFMNGYSRVKRDGVYGFIDISGELVIEPQFEATSLWADGCFAAQKDGKWGIMNLKASPVNTVPSLKDAMSMELESDAVVLRGDFCLMLVKFISYVQGTAESTDPINYLQTHGLIFGVSEEDYALDEAVTREQAAVFLDRTLMFLGYPMQAQEPVLDDAVLVSEWAYSAVGKNQASAILLDGTHFEPQSSYVHHECIQIFEKAYGFILAFGD